MQRVLNSREIPNSNFDRVTDHSWVTRDFTESLQTNVGILSSNMRLSFPTQSFPIHTSRSKLASNPTTNQGL